MIDFGAVFLGGEPAVTMTYSTGYQRVPASARGHSLMELVSMFAGELPSHEPVCVSPVLREFGAGLGRILGSAQRQELTRFIPRLLGTYDDGKDEARGLIALDWLVRVCAPALMRLAPTLMKDAECLAQSPPIVDLGSVATLIAGVREAADRASAGEGDIWLADSDAVVDAISDVAWEAINVAAQYADDIAIWADAGYVADMALRASRQAAQCVAQNVLGRGFSDDAVEVALAPVIAALQESAVALFDRMITGEPPAT